MGSGGPTAVRRPPFDGGGECIGSRKKAAGGKTRNRELRRAAVEDGWWALASGVVAWVRRSAGRRP